MTERFDAGAEPLAHRVITGLAKVGMALRSQAWQHASARGLTPTQGQVLALLRARPSGLRLGDLAGLLGVTAPTVSDSVSALVDKGLVEKRRSPDDGRAVALTLTAAGQEEAARAAGWSDFLMGAVEALEPGEQEVLLRALVKMVRTLQEQGQIPVARMCVTCRFFRPAVHPDPQRPHHCAFVDAAFGDAHLRLDCADHEPAAPQDAARLWAAFAGTSR